TMSSERGYLARHWGGWTVARLDRELAGTHATPAYVIVTPGQAEYLRMYGLVPPGSVGSLADALERDPRFAVVHHDGEATVFRWAPSR
ncbi:MAG: hypothetical protein ACXVFL_16170, partial [Solirubrobacteraceae bacterium]